MAEIKLTKNELRLQQLKLAQLEKYLPTLQLKKAMLQSEVQDARTECSELKEKFKQKNKIVEGFSRLFSALTAVDPNAAARVKNINKRYENIAGVEIPHYESVTFEEVSYSIFETPPWLDSSIAGIRRMVEAQARVIVGEEKIVALAKELREVSIRVNLFEKILIPRTLINIRKISVFLGDQQLAAVSQAKVAKGKIEARKKNLVVCK